MTIEPMPSASARAQPNSGPAPPKTRSAMRRGSSPRATLTRLSARAITAVATATIPPASISYGRSPGHEAGIGAGAAHVQREELSETHGRADESRTHDASGGTRQRERRGAPRGRRRVERTTGRCHYTERRHAAGAHVPIETRQLRGNLPPQARLRDRA